MNSVPTCGTPDRLTLRLIIPMTPGALGGRHQASPPDVARPFRFQPY